MSLRNGEVSSVLSRSHSAEGACFTASRTGSGLVMLGSSSVTSPRGSGLVLLIRRNWSRCTSTSSVTKAVTSTGRSWRRALARASVRCWPSTIHPGLGSFPTGSGISRAPLHAASSAVFALVPRLETNLTVVGRAMMIGLGKMISSLSR